MRQRWSAQLRTQLLLKKWNQCQDPAENVGNQENSTDWFCGSHYHNLPRLHLLQLAYRSPAVLCKAFIDMLILRQPKGSPQSYLHPHCYFPKTLLHRLSLSLPAHEGHFQWLPSHRDNPLGQFRSVLPSDCPQFYPYENHRLHQFPF